MVWIISIELNNFLSVFCLVLSFFSIDKIYQTRKAVFCHISKQFKVGQKYSAVRLIFNSLLDLCKCDGSLSLFNILHQTVQTSFPSIAGCCTVPHRLLMLDKHLSHESNSEPTSANRAVKRFHAGVLQRIKMVKTLPIGLNPCIRVHYLLLTVVCSFS